MRGRNAASGHQQVSGVLRLQAAIRNRIPCTLLEVVMAGSAAVRAVNVDVVVSGGNGILELCAVLQLLLSKHMLAHDHAAFTGADFTRRIQKLAVLEAGNVIMQEVVHFEHLLARDHLGAGNVQRIRGVVLHHASGIEVQHAVHKRVENQHVFARIGNFPFILKLFVHILHQLTVLPILLQINIANAEAQRHRLAQAVLAPQLERTAGHRRQVCIPGAIDKIARLKGQKTRLGSHLHSLQSLSILFNAAQHGMEKHVHTLSGNQTIHRQLQILLMNILAVSLF